MLKLKINEDYKSIQYFILYCLLSITLFFNKVEWNLPFLVYFFLHQSAKKKNRKKTNFEQQLKTVY